MAQFQFNFNKNDEYYTPVEAVEILLPYLKKNSTILCPFDTKDSNYVKVLRKAGHTVLHSHISEGKDFFKCRIKSKIDYIISNPPYSKKTEVFAKLFELGIPFAMLLNIQGIFDNRKRVSLFKNKPIEFMYIYPRVRYIVNGEQTKGNIFQSAYVCSGILPKGIIIEELEE